MMLLSRLFDWRPALVVVSPETLIRWHRITPEQRAAALGEDQAHARTGVFTSGVVSICEGRKIVLFFTGVRHVWANSGSGSAPSL